MNFYEDADIFEDDLDILEVIDGGFPRLRYTRSNHFHDMDEFTFFKRFRLTKQTCLNFLILIEDALEYPNNVNDSVSPMNQLLLALKFYASNGHLSDVAYIMGVHTSTASRIVKRVSQAIARLRAQYVNMPQPNQIAATQNNFFQIAQFPRVVGAIDGTHIRIQSPGGEDGEIFRNRKGYFSINCQAVCDANMKILDIVARWPGSAHDATIFNNSRIKTKFENREFPNCVLLGDSGYALNNYFLTPLLNPNTRAQQANNSSHIRTRNVIERVFGCWKRRFPVLAYGSRIKIQTTLTVIVATAILHNICLNMNEADPPPPENIDEANLEMLIQDGNVPNLPDNQELLAENNTRTLLINNYFSNL